MTPTDPDVLAWNREAWDHQASRGNVWTVPVAADRIEAARRGDWFVWLISTKPVPRGWFPRELRGQDVLCLASGGGQQGPVLAAAGARVTVFDNSDAQLARDRGVAEQHGLDLPFYHARAGDAWTRETLVKRFMGQLQPDVRAIICTNAFGMGLDVPNCDSWFIGSNRSRLRITCGVLIG